ncbi:pseudaminic acid synthase [Bacillus sp. JJ1122]|uniref:pseudaminic acid synthase n=1 Tax=Bacillus sp. JJ1122 TaxID=3122951 RepID=UPI002FFFD8CE
MKIGNFDLSDKIFIIAELSANHGHDIEVAKRTILAMKESGADAVKLQTYRPDTITLKSDKSYFRINQDTLWDGKVLYDLYEEAFLPWEWHGELFVYAQSLGLEIFSSPFDSSAVDFLEELNAPAYKIASFEITDIPLIEYVAAKGKPIIISTGIATKQEIFEAIGACKRQGNDQIVLLKCTSAYPAKLEDANLLTMVDMKKRFNIEIGLSDHTMGSLVPIVAAGLGARVIEKHFILDKFVGGPDAEFSMTPTEFKEMVDSVRNAEASLGKIDYELNDKKMKSRKFSRSLFVTKPIKKGEKLTLENIKSVRPSDGIAPKYLKEVLNKKVNQDIDFAEPLTWNLIEEAIKGE